MDNLRKILRRAFIIVLILLAGTGIGIAGAAIFTKPREDSHKEEALIEVVEVKEDVASKDQELLELS